jgi:alpha-D-ribose 1-methylphosphonate 5-triphosphate diphosphatase
MLPKRETQHRPEAAGTRRLTSDGIVLADRVVTGTITIEAGLIAGIDEGVIDARADDWRGTHVLPGLIELHTDHLETHYAPRPKVIWNPAAAVLAYDAQVAAAGITTVFDSLRAGADYDRTPVSDGLMHLGEALATARRSTGLRINHFTHLRCEICCADVVTEVQRFLEAFDVDLISLMDHTPGVRQYRDVGKFRDYYRGKSGTSEAELDTLVARRREAHARYHEAHRRALIEIARHDGIVLASHDDTTIEHVAQSHADGIAIAEFPTTMEAAQSSARHGIVVMMGAPNVVRGGSHSGNVSAMSLAQAGVLDALSSDYVPASLLHGSVMLADVPAIGGLAGAIRLVTKAPAEAMGLHDRGEIAVGKRADLTLADLGGAVPIVREVLVSGRRVA